MNENLMDLCRVNLMGETVEGSPAVDRDETMRAIDWKKRHLVVKIGAQLPPVEDSAMDRHRKRNAMFYKSGEVQRDLEGYAINQGKEA